LKGARRIRTARQVRAELSRLNPEQLRVLELLALIASGGATSGSHLTADQRSALGMLAASLRGRTESMMLAHGFAIGMLRGLVRDGLATAVRGAAYYNRRAVLVNRMQITDAGRRAIES
jgi:hypothetical protein